MKYLLLFALNWFSIHACLQAQHRQKYIVHTGEIVTQVIPAAERMHYGQFKPARVIYHNGQTASLMLNYSYLPGEMHFIGPKGDTLAMVDDPLVKSIQVGEDVFYYLPRTGYLLALSDTYPVKPVEKQIIKIIKGEPSSGYQGASQVVSPIFNTGDSQGTVAERYVGPKPSNEQLYYQPVPNLVLLSRQVSFYLMDKNQRFYEAKKSNLFKLFPGYHRPIKQYIQEQSINFKSKQDLIQVIQYCSQLQRKHPAEQ
ncbi:hypothetical protein Q0590_36795 [Rhodocytophaga aerolata]|uniref:DUF4384 domain-containing protein n=1 Tax=Rhodocytophaga aerolata TaxID=455078 RepID=A0ABT8RJB9_9BACT|nr:hypothetical protein [Rhodocytophaga aerolata]MDO1451886.1 hypothetical protein [Rhodocytophaga aerolata]